jgi:hypothetical protein
VSGTIPNYPENFVANHIETNYIEIFVVNYKRIEVCVMTVDSRNLFDNKVLAIVGNWEPMFHRIRGGHCFTNEKERYDFEHSEEMVRQLADEGINVVMMHYYKGMGFDREKSDMEDTRRFIEICHKVDILVGTYTQWGTFWNETFPAEHPEAMDYCQRDMFGQPSLYSETYFSYHRNRICASSEKFAAFLKEVARYSVEGVGTDLVYFDNLGQNPCYCERCAKAFPAFIAERYPDPGQRMERLGFAELDAIQSPRGVYWRPIQCMDTISDPLVQEWVEFRCRQLNEAFVHMEAFLATLDRQVPMAFNPPALYGDNAAMAYGVDWPRLMQTSRMSLSEDGNVTQVTEDGRLISQHRAYKTTRARQNSCVRFHTPWIFADDINPELVALSEAAVFNDGNLGLVKSYAAIAAPLHPEQKQYIKYFRDHQQDYAGVEQVSEVAVYKNFESPAWSWLEVCPQLTIVEQLLIQSGTQFSYIIDDDPLEVEKYKAVVVTEMQCLSREQAERIARFVEQGGGLLVTGQSGSRNPWYRRHEFNRLAGLLGRKVENISETAFVAVTAGAGGDTRVDPARQFGNRWEHGKGKVCWMPRAVMTHPLPPSLPGQLHTMIHGNSHWDVPGIWREMLDGLDWALADGRWVPMDTPSTVVPQVSRTADGEQLLVHLVSYEPGKRIEGLSIRISASLIKPVRALWRTPEEPEPVKLERKLSSTGIELALPPWIHHGTIILL